MRLSPNELTAIRMAATKVFGADAVVRLFGSRVDDNRRGGDIDLHVEASGGSDDWTRKCRFLEAVESATDGRKIDLVLTSRGRQPRGIERIAYRDGIVL